MEGVYKNLYPNAWEYQRKLLGDNSKEVRTNDQLLLILPSKDIIVEGRIDQPATHRLKAATFVSVNPRQLPALLTLQAPT